MVLVTEPRRAVHEKAGHDVRRRDESLGLGEAETHALAQDNGQEVGDGVGNRGQAAEDDSEAPDLHVECWFEEGREAKRLGNGIATCTRPLAGDSMYISMTGQEPRLTILVYSSHNEVALLLVEETARLVSVFGEIDQHEEAEDADEDGDDALHDEDPRPAAEAAKTLHLHEPVCQYAR